jgi:hypothetical protein
LKHVTDERIVVRTDIIQRWNVFPGTNENMDGSLWTYVFECHDVVIFVHHAGGKLTLDDLAEKTRLHRRTLTQSGVS